MFERLKAFVRALGPIKLGIIASVALTLLGALLFVVASLQKPQMTLLYGHLDPARASKMAAQLSVQGIPFEILDNGRQIDVPADQVSRLRISMASQGLSGSVVGYELFDKESAYNTSSFLQQVNQVRALEGELTRTIDSLDGVVSARVHIVLPRRELFSRQTRKATASILLRMEGSRRLGQGQVSAIENLVASAVPKLEPKNISIVDEHGRLLSRNDQNDEYSANTKLISLREAYEDRLRRHLEALLEKTTGPGQVRVEVQAALDMEKTLTEKKAFDPDGRVLRSQETKAKNTLRRDAGDEPVTVQTNLPNAPAQLQGGAGILEKSNSSDEISNYDITQTTTHASRPPGTLRRLSVAVLVNDKKVVDSKGDITYTPLSPEVLTRLSTLVKSAVGYNARRGDLVHVVNMRFAASHPFHAVQEKMYLGLPVSDVKWIIKTLLLALLSLLILFLLVRPLLKHYLLPGTKNLSMEPALATVGAPPETLEARAEESPTEEEDAEDHLIDVKNIEGRVKASSMRKIAQIIDKHPEEAVSIIRSWLYEDGS